MQQRFNLTTISLNHWIVLCFLLLGVVARVVPHPANFAPIAAIAIFGGAKLPRKLAFTLPLVIMIVSDVMLGLHDTIMYTWGSFLLIALLSNVFLRNRENAFTVVGSGIIASVLFFIITNFGVWVQGSLYPSTVEGLIQSYVMAIPFFRNTLAGDIVYTSIFFGAFSLVEYWQRHSRHSEGDNRVKLG